MKNKFLLSAITFATVLFSTNSFADIHMNNTKGQKIVVETPFQGKSYDDVPDIYTAVAIGDLDFINNALALDPKLFAKYNNSDPQEILGFNALNLELINVVLKSDPNLLGRYQDNTRNIASTMLFNHWDELTHKPDIEYFLKYEDEIKKMGLKMKEGSTLLKKSRKDLEDMALATSAHMPPDALNIKDIFGNTTLHYAVGRKLPRLVAYLLETPRFTGKSAFNNYGETAIFMLVDNSCKTSPEDQEASKEVLKSLLKSKTSLFQKNISGFSFPALVFGLPNLEYLAEVLEDEVSESYLKMFKAEAELVKAEFAKGDSEKLYTSIQRNGYWSNNCRHFEDKKTK